jgi:hypothetical protein
VPNAFGDNFPFLAVFGGIDFSKTLQSPSAEGGPKGRNNTAQG